MIIVKQDNMKKYIECVKKKIELVEEYKKVVKKNIEKTTIKL